MTGIVFFSWVRLLLILYLVSSCEFFLHCFDSIIYATYGVVGSAIFRENELKITIQCNLQIIVDYLDVTFNLTNSSYRSFNKTNNEKNYKHKQSTHPLTITKQLLLSVERRLSKFPSNE